MPRKKKRQAPSKKCLHCGKNYHPACHNCPHCGTPNPTKIKSIPKTETVEIASAKPEEPEVAMPLSYIQRATDLIWHCKGADAAVAALNEAIRLRG